MLLEQRRCAGALGRGMCAVHCRQAARASAPFRVGELVSADPVDVRHVPARAPKTPMKTERGSLRPTMFSADRGSCLFSFSSPVASRRRKAFGLSPHRIFRLGHPSMDATLCLIWDPLEARLRCRGGASGLCGLPYHACRRDSRCGRASAAHGLEAGSRGEMSGWKPARTNAATPKTLWSDVRFDRHAGHELCACR